MNNMIISFDWDHINDLEFLYYSLFKFHWIIYYFPQQEFKRTDEWFQVSKRFVFYLSPVSIEDLLLTMLQRFSTIFPFYANTTVGFINKLSYSVIFIKEINLLDLHHWWYPGKFINFFRSNHQNCIMKKRRS